jgi:hypothetical protein
MIRTRTEVNDRVVDDVATMPGVLDKLADVGDKISADVKRSTGSSRTTRPFGRMMSVTKTETGVRVGTSWGPAVPVEYGTYRTPARRILLSAAEKAGKVSFR